MDIDEASAAVAQFYCAGGPSFNAALGRLIGALLANHGVEEWRGKFSESHDGIVFELENDAQNHFTGHGVSVLVVEQNVEPTSIEMWFDDDTGNLERATILFGMSQFRKAVYGSSEANKIAKSVLSKALSARPKIPFEWKYRFVLDDGKWLGTTLS